MTKFIKAITLLRLDQLVAWLRDAKLCAACRKEKLPAGHIFLTPKGPYEDSMFVHFVVCDDCVVLMENGGPDAEAVKAAIHTYMKNQKLDS